MPRLLRPVLAVVMSSAVAGAATAPVAAAHFNRIADYGLIANLLSVPLMGAVVMPAAVLAALLAPFGLAGLGLAIMGPPIDWILGVAHWVAGLDGAVTPVITPPAAVLPLFALGMLWLILWRGLGQAGGTGPGGAGVRTVVAGGASAGADLGQRRAGRGDDRNRAGAVETARRRIFGAQLAGKRRRRRRCKPAAFARPGLTIDGAARSFDLAGQTDRASERARGRGADRAMPAGPHRW